MITHKRVLRHLGRSLSRTSIGYAGRRVPDSDTCLTPLILDAALPIELHSGRSLLMLPMGAGLVIDQLARGLSVLGPARLTVVAPPGERPRYEDHLDPDILQRLRIVGSQELAQSLARSEAADYLLVVDPRYWPVVGFDFRYIAAQARRYQGATHAIAVGGDDDGTRERVEYDAQGRIRRVQRLYSPMSWPATTSATVFCCAVPARALYDTPIDSLGDLRCHLVRRGMLTQDLPVLSDVDVMTSQAGILARSQRMLADLLAGEVPAGLTLRSGGILVGEGCRIDPTARLVPPLLIQDFVTIEPEAMVIGPAVIGSGSRVGSRTILAQSVLLPRTHLPADATVSNCIGGAETARRSAAADLPPVDLLGARDLKPCDWQSRDLTLQDVPRRRLLQRAVKRTLDILLTSAGLLLLSPLLAAVAILVKCTSPGPVFFVHRREGKDGRSFGCIKFRTMVPDAHARQRELYKQNQVDGPQFKITDDPRVTRVGKWLRATNVDELPQLFNVLLGQMSLVGPRPSPFRENQICVAWRRARLSVRPGITGLWQICRDRQCDGDFHQWIFYDIMYVRHFSLGLDLKILARTILSGGGRKRVALAKLLAVEEPETAPGNGQY